MSTNKIAIQALAETLNQKGFLVHLWQDRRIYLNGLGKDIKAFFDYPEGGAKDPADPDAILGGANLRVFCESVILSNQAKQDRAKQAKFAIMQQMDQVGLAPCGAATWEEIIL